MFLSKFGNSSKSTGVEPVLEHVKVKITRISVDDVLYDIGTLFWVVGLFFSLKFLLDCFKDDRKKMKTHFYLMILVIILGIICKFYHVIAQAVIGIGVLCLLVSGILIVSAFAVGLSLMVKSLVTLFLRGIQNNRERQQNKRKQRLELARKRKRPKHIRIKKHYRLKKKQIENFIDDIPDDSFFEVQLPPGGLE